MLKFGVLKIELLMLEKTDLQKQSLKIKFIDQLKFQDFNLN